MKISNQRKILLISTGLISVFNSMSIQTGHCAVATKEWLSVPIFFATSREFDEQKKTYSGRRNVEHKNHGLEYGIVTARVPKASAPLPKDSALLHLERKQIDSKAPKGAFNIEKLTRDEFYKRLKESTNSSESKETCLFVHGYNNSFEGAAQSAARLELSLNEPVVLFSWPSGAKTKNYTVDECNAEWSSRPFQIVVQGLEKTIAPENLMTVSHSMGNRLINWYLMSRYDKLNAVPQSAEELESSEKSLKPFREIVLTSPDIDRATFKNYFYKIAENGNKVRLYVSDKDIPLRLSRFLHGSPRTGSGMSKSETKWDMPGNIPPTQTINFTEVDDSLIGHSIQYRLISSMHRSNAPGDGLTLVEDKDLRGDYVKVIKDKH